MHKEFIYQMKLVKAMRINSHLFLALPFNKADKILVAAIATISKQLPTINSLRFIIFLKWTDFIETFANGYSPLYFAMTLRCKHR